MLLGIAVFIIQKKTIHFIKFNINQYTNGTLVIFVVFNTLKCPLDCDIFVQLIVSIRCLKTSISISLQTHEIV